jgi:hypothetical protein
MDRRQFFAIAPDGSVTAQQNPAGYMISLLALDRPFLRRLRENRVLKAELAVLVANLQSQAKEVLADNPGVNPKDVCRLVLEVTEKLGRLLK